MLRFLKVSGQSLQPEYRDGDYVLILRSPSRIQPGATIVFRHSEYGEMIKKVAGISADGVDYFVVGTHPVSRDSRTFGPICKEDIVGKVIWHIPRPAH